MIQLAQPRGDALVVFAFVIVVGQLCFPCAFSCDLAGETGEADDELCPAFKLVLLCCWGGLISVLETQWDKIGLAI